MRKPDDADRKCPHHPVRRPVPDNQNSLTAGPRGPLLAPGPVVEREVGQLRAKSSPSGACTPRARARSAPSPSPTTSPRFTRAAIFSEVGKTTRCRPLHHRGRRTRRGRRRARHPRLRAEVLHRGRQLGHGRQQHAGVLPAIRASSRTSTRRSKRDPRTNLRSATHNWDFWTRCPKRCTRSPS